MTRTALIGALAALVALLLVGCATTPTQRYKTGVLSKTTAETTYQLIYRAYRDGHVTQEDMDRADQAYQYWATLQALYIEGAKTGRVPPGAGELLAAALQVLIDLAGKYHLL